MNLSISAVPSFRSSILETSYKKGYGDGKIDGTNGNSKAYMDTFEKDKDLFGSYDNGYNLGYEEGRRNCQRNYISKSDVVQEYISMGANRAAACNLAKLHECKNDIFSK